MISGEQVTSDRALLDGLSISLTFDNILNARPKRITVPAFYFAPYDSTNYSPRGRFASLTIQKTL